MIKLTGDDYEESVREYVDSFYQEIKEKLESVRSDMYGMMKNEFASQKKPTRPELEHIEFDDYAAEASETIQFAMLKDNIKSFVIGLEDLIGNRLIERTDDKSETVAAGMLNTYLNMVDSVSDMYVDEPFGFSLLLSFLAMFFYLYAYEPEEAGKGWKSAIVAWYQKFKGSVFFRRLFFLAFVTSLILFRTLLNRQMWMNPLSDVMGGWGIWETVNGEQKLTTECIENVIMMMPFSAVVMWTFGEKIGKGWKKILWYSGKIAFIFSVSIEMLQLLLRLGTFQLSDIFYNTVGGVVGGLAYYVAMKARKRL